MLCKIFKLVTGETIAGNVVEETSIYIDLMQPVRLILIPKGNESLSIMFAKWDYTTDFDLPVRVFKSGLVSVGEPTKDFVESYAEMYYEKDNKQELTFDDDEDIPDDLSKELEEIVKKLSEASSNTNTKTYH